MPDIERLEFIEEMMKHAPEDSVAKFRRHFASAYAETRRYRLESISEVNAACEELLEYAAGQITSVLLRRNMTIFALPPGLERA